MISNHKIYKYSNYYFRRNRYQYEMQVSNDIFDAMKKVIILFNHQYREIERAKLNNQNTKKFNDVAVITGGENLQINL